MDNPASDFVRDIVAADTASGKHELIVTHFTPEPNGCRHIGHGKSICLNFSIALENKGRCHLRFDDTNPATEETEYVEAIKNDVRWLGFDWGEHLHYASDYFEPLYGYAVELIKRDKAYVCTLDSEQFKEYRGVPTRPGKESPSRNRPIEESLDLFERMKNGEFDEGQYVVRAKIDMNSPNLHMRDPVLYRIRKMAHHRTGDKWCIYPMYDFTHCLSDSIEGITHSICTLEFEVHRPLYDWILDSLEVYHPQQIEFARLNLTYTVMSKRRLLELVQGGLVSGWDDPRMPTLAGLRRRGYTPSAIREFCARVGVTKVNSLTDIALLEFCIREELNRTAPRAMAVLEPLKLIIDNYPEDQVDELDGINNPEDPAMGTRKVPFTRELFIEQDDFRAEPPPKFHRLSPGREVRLRYGYIIKCVGHDTDEAGRVTAVHCTYDPATRGGTAPDGRKIKGTIHWVSAVQSAEVEVRLYDRLFTREKLDDLEAGDDFKNYLNPDSLKTVKARVEAWLIQAGQGSRYQFERKGYFCVDPVDSTDGKPVFNQIVPLRDSWARLNKPQ
ncbi:MAG: glutamine--tRNA ligase/YqeY domain fusion protein [Lentisphaerales bacterium]|nr:MAG: glutamine--tRNA ligase/YqeY domain fusion protein [Lentisphaerales bacterium]